MAITCNPAGALVVMQQLVSLHVTEDDGDNQDKGGVIAKILADSDIYEPASYCCAGCAYAYRHGGGGCPWEGDGAVAYVPTLEAWSRDQGFYVDLSDPNADLSRVVPGCLIIFGYYSGEQAGPCHVGMLESIDADGTLHTIECNTGNGLGEEGIFRKTHAPGDGWTWSAVAFPQAPPAHVIWEHPDGIRVPVGKMMHYGIAWPTGATHGYVMGGLQGGSLHQVWYGNAGEAVEFILHSPGPHTLRFIPYVDHQRGIDGALSYEDLNLNAVG